LKPFSYDSSKISEVTTEEVRQDQTTKPSQVLAKSKIETVEEITDSVSESNIEKVFENLPQISEFKLENFKQDQKISSKQILVKPFEKTIEDKSELTVERADQELLIQDSSKISEVKLEELNQEQVINKNQILIKPLQLTVDETAETIVETEIDIPNESLSQISEVPNIIQKDQKLNSKQILSNPKEETVEENIEQSTEVKLENIDQNKTKITDILPEVLEHDQVVSSSLILSNPKEETVEENIEQSTEVKLENIDQNKTKITDILPEVLEQDQVVSKAKIYNKERIDSIEKDTSEHEIINAVELQNLDQNITKSNDKMSEISQIKETEILEKSSSDISDIVDLILEINKSNNNNDEKKPRFTQLLEDQEFNHNDNVHLDCFVEGQAPITVKWFFNNQLIQSSSDANVEIFRELGVCSMEIITASKNYQGIYKCYGSNEFGNDSTSCRLVYIGDKSKDLLTFTETLHDQTVEIGSEVFLDCSVKDIRKTDTIEWYHNYILIEKNTDENIEIFNEVGVCSLQIRKMTIELQGNYSCKVRDNNGYIVAENNCFINIENQSNEFINRTIYSKSDLVSNEETFADDSSSDDKLSVDACGNGIAPMFLQTLEDTEIEEDEDLDLKCQIMGAPIPEIACYFAKNITEKTAIKKIRSEFLSYNYETGICRIEIKNTKIDANEGFYMVKALNDAGSLTTVCQVRVRAKSFPVLDIQTECAPNFIYKLESEIKAMDGQEVNLVCICIALPEPDIKWLRNSSNNLNEFIPVVFNNDIRASFDKTTGKCSLRITDTYPQDSGTFICIATNKYGQAETRSNLIIECMLNDD